MSIFSFKLFTGILLQVFAFWELRHFTSNSTASTLILEKLKFAVFTFSLIFSILGCTSNFFRAISMGSCMLSVGFNKKNFP